MKINIQGQDYSFKFYHTNPQHEESPGKLSKKVETEVKEPLIRATTCVIYNSAGDSVASGSANVHPKDVFNREKGRRISLSRAMSSWDKEVRAQVWEEYRTWGAKDRW